MILRRSAIGVCLLALVLLAACAPSSVRWEPRTYIVQPGDTVYGIAWRYGLDYRELAAWNGLDSRYVIQPGQRLKLQPSAPRQAKRQATAPRRATVKPPPAQSRPATPSRPSPPDPQPRWLWPASGRIAAVFDDNPLGEGISLTGKLGDPIRAAAGGRVVYSGSGLRGYGALIIIKHNNTYLSAYAHNSELLVGEGDQVEPGDQIARMGQSPGQRHPVLHFEIRLDGKPVDPLKYLPRR